MVKNVFSFSAPVVMIEVKGSEEFIRRCNQFMVANGISPVARHTSSSSFDFIVYYFLVDDAKKIEAWLLESGAGQVGRVDWSNLY